MVKQIEKIVREAGDIIKKSTGDLHTIQKTSNHDLVTMYDKMVQEKLYKEFSELFPDAGFLGEEQLDKTSNNGGIFIIDPIDGTTNFIKGLNHSCISVGYCENGIMKCGVIYDPYKDELFSAEKGKGAVLNGKRIHVTDDPIEKVVAFFGTCPYYDEWKEASFKLAFEVLKKVIDVRRFGAAALDCCDVACGRAGIYFEHIVSPWDIAAGSIILEEAGAIVTDMQGNPLKFDKPTSILATAPQIHQQMLEIISECEKKL